MFNNYYKKMNAFSRNMIIDLIKSLTKTYIYRTIIS